MALFSAVPQIAINYGIKLIFWGENPALQIGDSADLAIYHQSGNSIIANEVGPLILRQNLDDGDIIFQCDDGSGGVGGRCVRTRCRIYRKV